MSKEPKNSAFQYATANHGWSRGEIIEDTDLITLEEAKELWTKYREDFIKRLVNAERPEMAIWTDMEKVGDYHTEYRYIHADDAEWDGSTLYRVLKTEVES